MGKIKNVVEVATLIVIVLLWAFALSEMVHSEENQPRTQGDSPKNRELAERSVVEHTMDDVQSTDFKPFEKCQIGGNETYCCKLTVHYTDGTVGATKTLAYKSNRVWKDYLGDCGQALDEFNSKWRKALKEQK